MIHATRATGYRTTVTVTGTGTHARVVSHIAILPPPDGTASIANVSGPTGLSIVSFCFAMRPRSLCAREDPPFHAIIGRSAHSL